MSQENTLFEAISNNDIRSFRAVLHAVDPDTRRSEQGEYALQAAAKGRQTEMVRLLLEAGAAVDATDRHGRTALHQCAWYFDHDVATLLVEAGADVNKPNHSNWTPIFLTSTGASFDFFIERGARVDVVAHDGETLLRRLALAHAGHPNGEGRRILAQLVEMGLVVADEPLDHLGQTLLMEVIERHRRGRNEIAHFLIEQGMDPLHATPEGVTALHLACEAGDLDMVRTLLLLGADPNAEILDDWYGYEKGQRPADLADRTARSFKAIKAALAGAGYLIPESTSSIVLDADRVVIPVASEDPAAALDTLITITKEIDENLFKHPEYGDADGMLAFRFDVDGEPDAMSEREFFVGCVEREELRPRVEAYVRQIVSFNEGQGKTIYTHPEQEAGGMAIEALLRTGDAQYIPLFLAYLKSIDLEHTVHVHELIFDLEEWFEDVELGPTHEYLSELGL